MQHNLRIDVSVLQPQDSIPEKAPWIGALTITLIISQSPPLLCPTGKLRDSHWEVQNCVSFLSQKYGVQLEQCWKQWCWCTIDHKYYSLAYTCCRRMLQMLSNIEVEYGTSIAKLCGIKTQCVCWYGSNSLSAVNLLLLSWIPCGS